MLEGERVSEGMSEDQFFSAVSLIANKHGCRIIDIDTDAQIVNLEGPAVNEAACALELDEILHEYAS